MAKATKSAADKRERPRRRGYGELGGAKPRMFRASPDVDAILDAEVEKSGRTQSAIIDEGLRRAFWQEQKYEEALERNFGGRDNFAMGFLVARIVTGIEHDMKATVRDSGAVREQVAMALRMLADSVAPAVGTPKNKRPDLFVDTPSMRIVVEIKGNLSEGHNMCWPLTDTVDGTNSHARPRPPLRPSLDELRDVFSFFAKSWFEPEKF